MNTIHGRSRMTVEGAGGGCNGHRRAESGIFCSQLTCGGYRGVRIGRQGSVICAFLNSDMTFFLLWGDNVGGTFG